MTFPLSAAPPPPSARSAGKGEVVSAGEADLLGGERKLKPEGVKKISTRRGGRPVLGPVLEIGLDKA